MFSYRLLICIVAEKDFSQKYSRKRRRQATDGAVGTSGELDLGVVTGIFCLFNVYSSFSFYFCYLLISDVGSLFYLFVENVSDDVTNKKLKGKKDGGMC